MEFLSALELISSSIFPSLILLTYLFALIDACAFVLVIHVVTLIGFFGTCTDRAQRPPIGFSRARGRGNRRGPRPHFTGARIGPRPQRLRVPDPIRSAAPEIRWPCWPVKCEVHLLNVSPPSGMGVLRRRRGALIFPCG